MRWKINNGDNFQKTFGVPLGLVSKATFEALTSQLASCAVLGDEKYREDVHVGLFMQGALRPFDPSRRNYSLFTTQSALASTHQRSSSRDFNDVFSRGLALNTLSELDALVMSNAGDFSGNNPNDLYSQFEGLVQHRSSLQSKAVAEDRQRILREGPPKIDTATLNAAIHKILMNNARNSDIVATAMLQFPQGFITSCGAEEYCTTIGGIVKYRYYVAALKDCRYTGSKSATCEYRLGLDVQSTLSSSTGWRNKLLAGQGALLAAQSLNSTLEYRDWKWTIIDGINKL